MNKDEHGYAHSELTQVIIGTFYEVYNELGFGFVESVYETALSIALRAKGLKVERQCPVPVWFRGEQIGSFFADLIVNGSVILELNAARALEPSHIAQLLNYLRATTIEVGLVLNFGPRASVRRLLFTNDRKKNQCSSVLISG
ncbi:MAG: GxxExxY protein [Acidobacteriia bacterium]|nr:GxxExxY protein [Terriglobia bacterium]